jgi:N-formylglutamate amidohydrolase
LTPAAKRVTVGDMTMAGSIDDSQRHSFGEIPGSGGSPAYYLRAAEPSSIPVLVAVPHAGRAYPGSLLERMRHPGFVALRLEDRNVDLLAEDIARQTGAALLVAQAPRAMIDLNRAVDDVDWDMIGGGAPAHVLASGPAPGRADVGSYTPGNRARSGLGLIPRRLPGLGELWKRRHDAADLTARIAGIHAPYHACLAATLAGLRARWGSALLIDLHSMPPLPLRGGQPGPELVIGDRFGTTCHGGLVASAFAYFAEQRCGTAHNRPYAGGYVLERHAAPGSGLHALQLEISRASYLDSRLLEPGEGFAATVELMVGLVRRLASQVAALGQIDSATGWAEAAE